MIFKGTFEAMVYDIHPTCATRTDKIMRDIDVTVIGKRHNQHYRLTQLGDQLQPLRIGENYTFTVFVNGLRIKGQHVNKLLISQILPL